jgi:hypothetical protein
MGMIASGMREQSQSLVAFGEGVRGSFFLMKKLLSRFGSGCGDSEIAPTAPPQIEVASVTDSACQISYEASCSVPEHLHSQQAATPPGAVWTQFVPAFLSLSGPLLPLSVHSSFLLPHPVRTPVSGT